jgi:hypothetical protein
VKNENKEKKKKKIDNNEDRGSYAKGRLWIKEKKTYEPRKFTHEMAGSRVTVPCLSTPVYRPHLSCYKVI